MKTTGRLARLSPTDQSPFALILRLEDIRWLTGFTGSTAQLLVNRATHEAFLFVDGRYVERAEHELALAQCDARIVLVESGHSVESLIAAIIWDAGLVVDAGHLTAAHMSSLVELVSVGVEPTQMDALRRVKDEAEIALIALSASIADSAMSELVADGLFGRTERQIRNRLDHLMREGGADDVAFETIVATGPNGARPHHEPSDDVVEDGHGVVIDFGAMVNGYKSDMTRTIRVGAQSREYAHMYECVIEAQAAGVDAVRAGVVGSDVDAAVRVVFDREGLSHEYVHGTGHGIGLYIHEQPILSPRCSAVLSANEVVTVEPGLYRKGVGGVRIEDLVVVTGDSCRILTQTSKDLTCPRSPRTI
jgi:Xaa-Pro aminopeptidase